MVTQFVKHEKIYEIFQKPLNIFQCRLNMLTIFYGCVTIFIVKKLRNITVFVGKGVFL